MQTVSEVMTRDVRFVAPQESLQHAAQMMDELNVGALPVCDGERLVGMITDRDITIRATARGMSPQDAAVSDAMTGEVRWCFEDQPLDEVMIQMADSQIRRVPVVTHDDQHKLVGIVALGDVATRSAGQKQDVEETVEMVSSPSAPGRHPTGGDVAGRTGSGDSRSGAQVAGGTTMAQAGETAGRAAGASGSGPVDNNDTSKGVGGGDLNMDGLPPS
ncbi:CBS domain-containing protein [Noviherbaspirillum aridicola]|uniref:CBS domain-containing protein n=1 Tax=Noviherbaspirillum aridicola TaxID=2849687 RepID=A0ABQ4Q7N8_9BURK|nr:CBS domain-containing protein [Noviherbaspirillum aridicola]GIZ52795.1 hypothetical protein NCCP691_28090 [Noviherbaspirillum aridicola]